MVLSCWELFGQQCGTWLALLCRYKPEARVEKGSVVGIKGEKALNPCICLPVLLSM
jgi:hypothetical protein